jgi:hypothetical protein
MTDERDTSSATVQSNIFNPCTASACPAGPTEITNCGATSYGKTIWYDFYPDSDGTISIRTSGFDNVISLYTFDNNPRSPGYLVPDASHRGCMHQSSFPSEQLVAKVKKGLAYTVQIGGAVSSQAQNGAGGLMLVQFDFFAKPPRRLSAQATLTATPTSNGIELLSLSVSTARAATVSVDCGGFCGPQSKSNKATENFPVHGVRMPAGSKLSIRVTAKGSIGVLIEYDISRGGFTKHTSCTEPGSRKPRTTCH